VTRPGATCVQVQLNGPADCSTRMPVERASLVATAALSARAWPPSQVAWWRPDSLPFPRNVRIQCCAPGDA